MVATVSAVVDVTAPFVIGTPDDGTVSFLGVEALGAANYRLIVEVHGDGPMSNQDVQAKSVLDLEEWHGGINRLADFFDVLAAKWRGWIGELELPSDGPGATLRATHDGVGAVFLTAVVNSDPGLSPEWRAAVTTRIEPGGLAALADRLRVWLDAHASSDIARR